MIKNLVFDFGISWWTGRFSAVLVSLSVSPPVRALAVDGICAGVGSVLSFLPAIGTLFFCLSLLETSGFLDQSARWLDRPMSRIGLPGSAVVPGRRLSVTIHEGRNRQVRKLCELAGLRVHRLVRVSEGELRLGNLPPRAWRCLTAEEIAYLRSHL